MGVDELDGASCLSERAGLLGMGEDDGQTNCVVDIVVWTDHQLGGSAREFRDHGAPLRPAAAQKSIEPLDLRSQHAGLQLGDPHVLTNEDRFVVLQIRGTDVAAHVVVHERPCVDPVVVGQYRATLTARDVLVLVEAQDARVADGADAPTAVRHTDSLCCVFDHDQVVARRNLHDCIHVTHQVDHVNRDDRPRSRRDLPLDVGRVDRERLVDFDEHRDRADSHGGSRRRNPCVGGYKHFVAGADARTDERADQGARSAVDGQTVADAEDGLE
jgi:hypothetical protein